MGVCELIGVVLYDSICHGSLMERIVVTPQSERLVVVCGIRFAASVSWESVGPVLTFLRSDIWFPGGREPA